MAKYKMNVAREQALMKKVLYLRSQEWSLKAISIELGVGIEWIKRRTVPGHRERHNGYANEHRKRHFVSPALPRSNVVLAEPEYHHRGGNRKSRNDRTAEIMAACEQIEDTRDFTQRFFGDPLPGRSALDQKRRV